MNSSDPDFPSLAPTQDASAAAEPVLFQRYRRVRELGRGGMGLVLLAHDLDLDVPVALKLVPETIVQDTDGMVDLKKEVRRGMALTHPGIVRVYTFERDATAAAIVMEYVEGETLGEFKARQPERCFDGATVQPWLEQLCEVLDYAHREAQIAHRDLKPRNLILTPSGRLKVADFGISSSLSDTLSRVSVRLDASGTPPYMSPQQAAGERPSPLDDIYSLGATCYELLTSKPPFFRGNILAQVLGAVPPAMAERRRQLGITGGVEIPAVWETLVAACLAKDPADRPQDIAAVRRYFDPPPAEEAPEARPPAQPLRIPLHDEEERAAGATPALREWTHRPPRLAASALVSWGQTFVTVMAASALTAGALQAARTWSRHHPSPGAALSATPAPTPGAELGNASKLQLGGLGQPLLEPPRAQPAVAEKR